MPRFAEYFATVSNGKIVGLCEASPAHELLDNQIMLTREEYQLLHGARFARSDLDKIQEAVDNIRAKIDEVNDV